MMKRHFNVVSRENSLFALLTLGTQIDNRFQTQLPDAAHVICATQSVQAVRTKERSPLGGSSILGRIPT
jgi:hypothetical protein